MIFEHYLVIAANTSYVNAEEKTVKLSKGIIRKVEIIFPAGCGGLVKLQIQRFDVQLFPTSENQRFIGDNFPIVFSPEYHLEKSPYTLKLIGWNDDDTYQHTPVIRFEITAFGTSPWEKLLRIFSPPL